MSSRQETTYLLVRHKKRNLAAAIELDEAAETLDIKLTPGVILSGKVVDVEGRGIPDADISLTFWVSDFGYGSREVTKNDGEGRYEVRAVPSGHRYSVTATAEGYGEQYTRVDTGDAVDNRIELEPSVLAVANLSASGIVVDEFDQPVSQARIYAYGKGQPSRETHTDAEGKFTLENVCPGPISIQANKRDPRRLHARVRVEAGTTDIKIVVAELDDRGRRVPKQPPSLVGKPVSELKDLNLKLSPADVRDKMIVVCFFDMNQRPSRHCIRELAKRAEELKEKGVTILAVQASKVDENKLKEWVRQYNVPFSVGMVQGDSKKILFTWGVRSFPWLILADDQHIVIAEDFGPVELGDKIQTILQR